jgi:hypothetical protein
MPMVKTFREVSALFQANFEGDEKALAEAGFHGETQLKAYLIESGSKTPGDTGSPYVGWRGLDAPGWYIAEGGNTDPNTFFLDASDPRVWRLFSLVESRESDLLVDRWVGRRKGLDRCWLMRGQLLRWEGNTEWKRRGMGLKFNDGLSPDEDSGGFSLKAWHGQTRQIAGVDRLLKEARDQFAINSVRWQKVSNGSVTLSAEWYSDGKVTINRATSIDEMFLAVGEMATRYSDSLAHATKLRDETRASFELDFTQTIDPNAFAVVSAQGAGDMKLWLVEDDADGPLRRFQGVDLHTWDRLLVEVAPDHGFVTVPGSGCVNAAPRIATLQGEDNAGKTSVFLDGVELFA